MILRNQSPYYFQAKILIVLIILIALTGYLFLSFYEVSREDMVVVTRSDNGLFQTFLKTESIKNIDHISHKGDKLNFQIIKISDEDHFLNGDDYKLVFLDLKGKNIGQSMLATVKLKKIRAINILINILKKELMLNDFE